MRERLGRVLAAVAADPLAPVHRVEVLDAAGREQVVAGWNGQTANLPVSGCGWGCMSWLAVRAAGCPDVVAVVCGGVWLSYGELERRAGVLVGGAGGCWVRVRSGWWGLCLDRGVEMVTGIVAVWKAGAAYMPLDPGYPAGRLAFMLAESEAALVVSRRQVGVAGELAAGRVVWLDDPRTATLVAPAATWPGGGCGGGAAGVCDVYVGVDGSAEGGAGRARQCGEPGGGAGAGAGG